MKKNLSIENSSVVKFVKILGIMLVGLLIAGCGDSSSGGGSSSGSSGTQFKGGIDSLTLTLEPDAPPEIVYDSALSPFDIVIRLDNDGEADIPANSLRVALEGFDSQNWGDVQSNLVIAEELRGFDSIFNIEGDFEYASFENIEFQQELVQNTYTHNFIVKACYPYSTKVTFTACVDEDAKRSSRDDDLKLCEGFSERSFSVSSGPIGVNKIEQQIVNKKLRLIFSIVDRERENPEVEVYLPNSLNAVCDEAEGTNIQNEDAVLVSLNDPILGEFECNGGKRVAFTSTNEVRVTCEVDITNVPNQELPLALSVDYEMLKAFRDSLIVERSE